MVGLFAGQKQAPKDAHTVESVIARHLAGEKTETICNEVSSGIDHFKTQLVNQIREAPKLIQTTKPKKYKQSEVNIEEILAQMKQQIETMKRNIFKQVKGFTTKLNNTFASKLENKITVPVKVPKPFDSRKLSNQKGKYFDELKKSNKKAELASKFVPTKRHIETEDWVRDYRLYHKQLILIILVNIKIHTNVTTSRRRYSYLSYFVADQKARTF